jgi:hypothetical protein
MARGPQLSPAAACPAGFAAVRRAPRVDHHTGQEAGRLGYGCRQGPRKTTRSARRGAVQGYNHDCPNMALGEITSSRRWPWRRGNR